MEAAQKPLELARPRSRDHPRSGERVEETAFTSLGSECATCGGSGWIRVEGGDSPRYRHCECIKARIIHERLSETPQRFRQATFENYRPRSPGQGRALSFMRENPEVSYFLWGPYDSGKTHLLHAQYRQMALAGVSCNLRTTDDLPGSSRSRTEGSSPQVTASPSTRFGCTSTCRSHRSEASCATCGLFRSTTSRHFRNSIGLKRRLGI